MVKLKTYNCIVFKIFQHTKLHRSQNLRLGLTLTVHRILQISASIFRLMNVFLQKRKCSANDSSHHICPRDDMNGGRLA